MRTWQVGILASWIALALVAQGCAALCEDQCRARLASGIRSGGQNSPQTGPMSASAQAGGIASDTAQVRLSRVLPSGGRAVSLRVESTGAPIGWIRPDDRVDVLLLTTAASGVGFASMVLMQHARVLGVTRINQLSKGSFRMTIQALPTEAQALVLASRRGRFVVFLRNPKDRRVGPFRTLTARQLEDPNFWLRLTDERMRTLQRRGKGPPTCIPRSKRDRDIAL